MSIPILDLSLAGDGTKRQKLLQQLRVALFHVGFMYITNHGVSEATISNLAGRLPALFDLSRDKKTKISKLNSPHFLGYSGFGEETTLGKHDLREQFDYATELPAVYQAKKSGNDGDRDFSQLYWRLRGPNQWPDEHDMPGFRDALLAYTEALSDLSCRTVHLIEEALGIPVGTFDGFFRNASNGNVQPQAQDSGYLPAQHRMKLVKYPAINISNGESQGVGPHKDSSGWLTFLYQVGNEPGLEVLAKDHSWVAANHIPGTFVVNFGNAFEAATDGAVKATVHRVVAPKLRDRYSIPFFMGLPLDLKVSEMRAAMPEHVKSLRSREDNESAVHAFISPFLDPRWDSLGESQLRKWIRSHRDVAVKWYRTDTVAHYTDS